MPILQQEELNPSLLKLLQDEGFTLPDQPVIPTPEVTTQQPILNDSLLQLLDAEGFKLPEPEPLPGPTFAETPRDIRPEPIVAPEPELELPIGLPTIAAGGREREVTPLEQARTRAENIPLWQKIKDLSNMFLKDPNLVLAEAITGDRASQAVIKKTSREALKGVSLGNVEYVYDMAEKVTGISGIKRAMMSDDPEEFTRILGYYPEKGLKVVGGVQQAAGALAPLSQIFRLAGAATSILPKIPFLLRTARGATAGVMHAIASKPEDDSILNRFKQIPGDVLFFTAIEGGFLTIGQAVKVLRWNARFKGKGIEFEPNSEELRNLFKKMRGTVEQRASLTPEEVSIVDQINKIEFNNKFGWKKLLDEGWKPGVTAKGEPIPPEPRFGDIFRREGAIRPTPEPRPEEPTARRPEPRPEAPRGEVPPSVTLDVTPKPGGGYKYKFDVAPPPEAPARITPPGEAPRPTFAEAKRVLDLDEFKKQYVADLYRKQIAEEAQAVALPAPEGKPRAKPKIRLDAFGNEVKGARKGPLSKQPLLNFLRKKDGISEEGLKFIDWHGEFQNLRESPQKSILRAGKGRGLEPEFAAKIAHESGYIKEPDLEHLVAAINEEISGRPQPGLDELKDYQETLELDADDWADLAEEYNQAVAEGRPPREIFPDFGDVTTEDLRTRGEAERLKKIEERGEPEFVTEETPQLPEAALPDTVQRIEEPYVEPSMTKPQGLYTTPSNVKSPHLDLGGKRYKYTVNKNANVLTLMTTELSAGRDSIHFSEIAEKGGFRGETPGIAALRSFVPRGEFVRLINQSLDELVAELSKKFKGIEWEKYFDTQEILEGYGGVLAREKGYDAIWKTHPDPELNEFSEFVALTENAFTDFPKEEPKVVIPGEEKKRVAGKFETIRKGGFIPPEKDPARRDLFGKEVRPEEPKITKPVKEGQPVTERLFKPEEKVPKDIVSKLVQPAGFDQRGLASFSNVNKFLEKVNPAVEKGYVIEYGHTAGKDGWARVVDKKPPGQGKITSKGVKPPKFGEVAPVQLKLTKENNFLPVEAPKEAKTAQAKDDFYEESLEKNLPAVLKKMGVPTRLWGEISEIVVRNFKPHQGQPLEHYVNATWHGVRHKEKKRLAIRGKRGLSEQLKPDDFASKAETKAFVPDKKLGPEEKLILKEAQKEMEGFIEKTYKGDKEKDILTSVLIKRESPSDVARRHGVSRQHVDNVYKKAVKRLSKAENKALQKNLETRQDLLHSGLPINKFQIDAMGGWLRKYFTTRGNVDARVHEGYFKAVHKMAKDLFFTELELRDLKKWLKKNDGPGVKEYVLDLLQGNVSLEFIPIEDRIKDILRSLRARIDNFSRILIAKGDFSEELMDIIEYHIGSYLINKHLIYEHKRWVPDKEARENYANYLREKRPDTFGQLTEDQMKRHLDSIKLRRNLGLISARPKGISRELLRKRKALPPELEGFLGTIVDPVAVIAMSTAKTAKMAYMAEFFDEIKETMPELWTDDPQTAVGRGWFSTRLENDPSYGKMKNLWVPRELHEFIGEINREARPMERLIQKWLVSPWKINRTLGSIPTNARNFLAGPFFSILAQTSFFNPANWPLYADVAKTALLRKGSRKGEWSVFIEKGVTEVQFHGAEIQKFGWKDIARLPSIDNWEKVGRAITAGPKKALDTAGAFYNFQDQFWRMAAWKNYKKKGYSDERAIFELNLNTPNYAELPAVVEFLKKWPLLGPFVSFQANVIKILGGNIVQAGREFQAGLGYGEPVWGKGGRAEDGSRNKHAKTSWDGIKRAWRVAFVSSIPFILAKAVNFIFDVDEKEIKKLQSFMPTWRRHGNYLFYRDAQNKLKGLDLTYIWPSLETPGRITKTLMAYLRNEATFETVQQTLNLVEHPLFDVITLLIHGKDPFSGEKVDNRIAAFIKEIYVPQSLPIPDMESIWKGAGIRPGVFTTPQINKLIRAFNGEPDPVTGEIPKLSEELRTFFTGVRTFPAEPADIMTYHIRRKGGEMKRIINEYNKFLEGEEDGRKPIVPIPPPTYKVERRFNKDLKRLTKLKGEWDEAVEFLDSLDIDYDKIIKPRIKGILQYREKELQRGGWIK